MSANGNGGNGNAPDTESRKTGAAFGTQVIRLSGIHGLGMIVSNVLTFVSAAVIINFAPPSGFGQLGLLQFYAGLLTLFFTLASKQGTLKRTFGGGDDDEDDDDEDDDEDDLTGGLSTNPRRSFGTGVITITIVSIIGMGISVFFRQPISDVLLGGNADPSLLIWAALAGGTGALYRLTSISIWIERRPYAYIFVEVSKPIFTLAAVVILLVGGLGIEGAIIGHALGTGLAMLLSLFFLRKSMEVHWSWQEMKAIYSRGAVRVPLVLSMWTVGYSDVFILSRFVSHTELGIYHLASKAAFLVAVLPGGYRKALRPLQKTPMFRAVEDEYGVGTARGIQFGYFWLMLIGTLLVTTMGAHALLRIAPQSYSQSAPLIPVIAAGLVAPTVYRMINKSVKYADKRVPFIIGAICAMFAFIGLSLILVPRLGVIGTPIAMMGAFIPPSIVIFQRSQSGRSAIKFPWRMVLVSTISGLLVAYVHGLFTFGTIFQQLFLGVAGLTIWVALVVFFGGVPKQHRAPLWMMFKGLRNKGREFDGGAGLEALNPRERRALRRAIKRGMKPKKATKVLGEDPINEPKGGPEAILVHLMRKAAESGGVPGLPDGYGDQTRPKRDQRIGEFLFARSTIAERDQLGKRLISEGRAEAFDLHALEVVLQTLQEMPGPDWRDGSL